MNVRFWLTVRTFTFLMLKALMLFVLYMLACAVSVAVAAGIVYVLLGVFDYGLVWRGLFVVAATALLVIAAAVLLYAAFVWLRSNWREAGRRAAYIEGDHAWKRQIAKSEERERQ